MSRGALEQIVGRALTSPDFCQKLLNGHRHEMIAQFALSPEEAQRVMQIRADTLEEFARALYRWLSAEERVSGLQSVRDPVSLEACAIY